VVGDLRLNDEPLLAEVFGFIEERCSERVSLRDMARAVSLSRHHLTTVVRRKRDAQCRSGSPGEIGHGDDGVFQIAIGELLDRSSWTSSSRAHRTRRSAYATGRGNLLLVPGPEQPVLPIGEAHVHDYVLFPP
jgi:hypothetical protein